MFLAFFCFFFLSSPSVGVLLIISFQLFPLLAFFFAYICQIYFTLILIFPLLLFFSCLIILRFVFVSFFFCFCFYFLLYNIAIYYHVKCESVCVGECVFCLFVFLVFMCWFFVYKTWLSSPPYTNKCVFVSVWECLFSSFSMLLVYTFFVLFMSHAGSINTVFSFSLRITRTRVVTLTLMLRSFYCLLFTHIHSLAVATRFALLYIQ